MLSEDHVYHHSNCTCSSLRIVKHYVFGSTKSSRGTNMNRSGSSRKSFLDDLLGDNNDDGFSSLGAPSTITSRPTSAATETVSSRKPSKSVRFSEGIEEKSLPPASDWLGLSSGDDDQSSTGDLSTPSWLDPSPRNSIASSRTTSSIIQTEPSKSESRSRTESAPIKQPSAHVILPKTALDVPIPQSPRRSSIEAAHSAPTTAAIESSNLLLQTQLKVIEVEKDHLAQMLEQSKLSHQRDIELTKEMYEKQLSMTRFFLERQEESTREEKERRIEDLKKQILSLEEEKNQLSQGYKTKLKEILDERDAEISRLKDRHAGQVNRILEEHEAEVDRLKKSKDTEVDTVVSMYSLTESLETLLSRWKTSTMDMNALQESLMEKQGKFIHEVVDSVSAKELSLTTASTNWSKIRKELEDERIRLKELEQNFMSKIEQHNESLSVEQKRLSDEREAINQEKRIFDKERRDTEQRLKDQEEKLKQDQAQFRSELDKLRSDQRALQERIRDFTVKEKEGLQDFLKQSLEFESERLKMEQDRTRLDFALKDLEVRRIALKEREHHINEQKTTFQIEKEGLLSLAQELKERTDQLESMNSQTIQRQETAIKMEEKARKTKEEADSKYAEIQLEMKQLQSREDFLRKEVQKIQTEWRQLEEMKDSALCSICSSRLTAVKSKSLGDQHHYQAAHDHNRGLIAINGNKIALTNGNQELPVIVDESSLLLWQISSQAEAAFVAEETEFIRRLQQQSRSK